MDIPRIIFVVVYLALLCTYFFAETSGIFKFRVVIKVSMASLFLAYFLAEFFRNGFLDNRYAWFCVAAFVFSWLGDVLLLFSFFKGGVAFMTGNAFFTIYLAFEYVKHELSFASVWWVIPLIVLPSSIFFILYFTGKVDFKKIGVLMPVYVTTVTLHGMLSIVLAAYTQDLHNVLLATGLGLFMLSDYFLTVHKFIYKKNWVLRCNSGTYFIGMLLAALSFSF